LRVRRSLTYLYDRVHNQHDHSRFALVQKVLRVVSRKQMLIFNPLILCLISWGIYIIKTTASKINKQSRDCPSEPLTKLIREIDFILMGSIVINGVYFLISLLLTVASLILKRCRKSDEQLSSDEQDE
jgi:hypothetical protein